MIIKSILYLMAILMVATAASGFGLVTNGPGRDTTSIPFVVLDSMGNAVNLAAGDSVYLVVFYPGGNLAYKDSMGYDDSRITGCSWENFNGGRAYVFSERVAILDGDSPVNGVYSYIIMIDDNTSADLLSSWRGTFQVVNATLESSLDSAAFARRAIDSLNMVLDSLGKIIDSLESQAGWVGNVRYSAGDSTFRLRRFVLTGNNGDSASFLVSNQGGDAVRFTAAGGSGDGLHLSGDGAGYGLRAGGTTAGHDIYGDLAGTVDSVKGITTAGMEALLEYDTSLISAGIGAMLKDTSAYQGAGAAVDSLKIARWVWNSPQNNHTAGGTFGRYLDAEISGIGGGSGLYSYCLTVIDSTIDQVVPGVQVAVRNLEQSALIASGVTDERGRVLFNLDADTMLVAAFAAGYIFPVIDSLVIEGSFTDTIFGRGFDPGSPGDPELCRVYGFLSDISGRAESGAVVAARLPDGVSKTAGRIISPFKVENETDDSGYFYLDLIPTCRLEPDTVSYEITINRPDGTILRERIMVPDQTDWLLVW